MAQIIDYEYIDEISTEDALKSLASDTTNGYTGEMPGVNTFLINAENQVINLPEGGGGDGSVAGWNTDVVWSAGTGSISWGSGNLNLPDGTQVAISSGSTSVSTYTYIYVDTTTGTVNTSTSALDAVGENKIMLCVAFPNSGKHVTYKAFGSPYQNSLTTGSDIANGTITTSLIQSEAITTNLIAADAVTANEIASNSIAATHIRSGAVTASKIDVDELSAITANLGDVHVGSTSGSGAGIRIYPYTSSQGRVEFYYNGDVVGSIRGANVSGAGDAVYILGGTGSGYIALGGTTICLGKLRIPVGNNLYE